MEEVVWYQLVRNLRVWRIWDSLGRDVAELRLPHNAPETSSVFAAISACLFKLGVPRRGQRGGRARSGRLGSRVRIRGRQGLAFLQETLGPQPLR